MVGGTAVRGVGAAVALTAVLALAACGAASGVDAQGPVTPEPSTAQGSSAPPTNTSTGPGTSTASPTSGAFPESDQILNQYRAFFAAIAPVWAMPDAAARAAAMAKLAVDPEYTTLLSTIKATRDVGEVGYGSDVVRPDLQSVVGGVATLVDCQDTSNAGRMKITTGEKVTKGHKNDLVRVTMKRGADGIWRVATLASAAAGSCHVDG